MREYNIGDYVANIGRISTVSINFKNPEKNIYEIIRNGKVLVFKEGEIRYA